mgnify:CR=1 FL=1
MKKILLSLLILSVLLAGVTLGTDRLDKILKDGKIVVGIALGGPPIGFRNEKNEPMGYDVDIAKLLAEALGVKLEIVEVTGATRIPMLMSGKIDLVIANMTANLERAKSIDFTMPYLRTGIKLLVRTGSDIKGIEDFNGRKVAIGRGTTGEALVKKMAPNTDFVYIEEFTNAILLLRQNKVEAAIEDGTLVDYMAGQYAEFESLPTLYTSDPIAIGVQKGNPDLLRWTDMFVSQLISNGIQKELYEKWWGVEPTAQLNYVW